MVVIGVDAHKRTHTLVAVDEAGRKLGERTVAATSEGHLQAARWAGQWPGARFALEDCRHLTRRLEGDLLTAGFAVGRVHTRLVAAARRGGRGGGGARPPRSPRWQSRGPRCGSRTFRPRAWTARPGRSSCCRTTAAPWSP